MNSIFEIFEKIRKESERQHRQNLFNDIDTSDIDFGDEGSAPRATIPEDKAVDSADSVNTEHTKQFELIHDELSKLNSGIQSHEYPYLLLEKALKIIRSLISNETEHAKLQKSIDIIHAQILDETNVKLYQIKQWTELSDKISVRL